MPSSDDELLAVLEQALAGEPGVPSEADVRAVKAEFEKISTGRRSTFGSMLVRPKVAAAVLAGLLGLVLSFLLGSQLGDDGAGISEVALGTVEFREVLASPDGGVEVAVVGTRLGIGRTVTIDTTDLAILPKGEFYEVWFIGPGDSEASLNRISAGTFHPDDKGVSAVVMTAAVDPSLYPVLAVTAETADGDPAPSGNEVLRSSIRVLE